MDHAESWCLVAAERVREHTGHPTPAIPDESMRFRSAIPFRASGSCRLMGDRGSFLSFGRVVADGPFAMWPLKHADLGVHSRPQ